MDDSYESVTAAAISAIQSMAEDPRDAIICDAVALRALAAKVYWSWAHLVGGLARSEDSERMERLIIGMNALHSIQRRQGQ